jgi:hypothetical protein
MQADIANEYTVLINEHQRRVLVRALARLRVCDAWPDQISRDELQECTELLVSLNDPDAPLTTTGLNDLTPIF